MVDIGTRGGKRLTLPAELERDRVLLITTQYLHRCVSIKTSPSIHSSHDTYNHFNTTDVAISKTHLFI